MNRSEHKNDRKLQAYGLKGLRDHIRPLRGALKPGDDFEMKIELRKASYSLTMQMNMANNNKKWCTWIVQVLCRKWYLSSRKYLQLRMDVFREFLIPYQK